MSFCVNCGVRLGASERKCPLCGVQVINPIQPQRTRTPALYPPADGSCSPVARFDRRTIAFVITCVLALPALLSAAVDWVYGDALSWSLYVLGAAVMLWVFFVLPLLATRAESRERSPAALLIPDTVALLTYLWLIERLSAPDTWFVTLALPIAGTVCLLVIVNAVLIHRCVLRGLYALVAILLAVAWLVVTIEVVTGWAIDQTLRVTWSLLAAIPLVVFVLILLLLGRNPAFRADVARKMHF